MNLQYGNAITILIYWNGGYRGPKEQVTLTLCLRACSDPMERERESAKLLLFCTFFALLDPNIPKCKRANATVILLIMD
jgi:hypothetical protein